MPTEEYNKALNTELVEHGKVGAVEGKLHRDRLFSPGPTAADLSATASHDQATGARIVRVAPFIAFVVGMWVLTVDRGIELGVTLGLYEDTMLAPDWYMGILLVTPIVLAFVLRKIIPIVFYIGLSLWLIWWLVF